MIDILQKLVAIGAIRLETHEMDKDFFTPFSVDFSRVISHADVAKEMSRLMGEASTRLLHDVVCGAPVVGSCLATSMAWDRGEKLIALKDAGVERVVGMVKSGERVLLCDGVDPFGKRLVSVIDTLEDEGFSVPHVLVFMDCGLGAKKKVKGRGVAYHAVVGMGEALDLLLDSGKVKGDAHKLAKDFLEERQLGAK